MIWRSEGSFYGLELEKHDLSDMSPKAHYSELTMTLFRRNGVEPRNIEAIAQTRIINSSAMKTIQSIFESFKVKRDIDELVISRSDTSQTAMEAFDAYFRTANGKGIVNLLAFHAEELGFRSPQTLVLRVGMTSPSHKLGCYSWLEVIWPKWWSIHRSLWHF